MKTTETENTLLQKPLRKTIVAKPSKAGLKSLSLKPVRSMKKMASLKVRPVLNGTTQKEAL